MQWEHAQRQTLQARAVVDSVDLEIQRSRKRIGPDLKNQPLEKKLKVDDSADKFKEAMNKNFTKPKKSSDTETEYNEDEETMKKSTFHSNSIVIP